jgi:DNA replication protein DnaC
MQKEFSQTELREAIQLAREGKINFKSANGAEYVEKYSEEEIVAYIQAKEKRRNGFGTTNKVEKTFSNDRHDFWVRTETDAAGDTKKIYGIIPKDTEYDGAGYFNPSPILEVKGYNPADFDKYFTEK